ncbi:hypothetical protein DFH08DRAFT_801762 [Mycena albidolilacea]|uniref:Uncharacterized protein n=1 Tax=Mycena albidolilacea TaxID=1033008 RepID=A0AAD7EY69_9AGAR|nr:hypothetical protein DFH08DRAFT_801762 [Mycena albidolilacea]
MAFFHGSLTTWIRFSAKFALGALIDECSATEKQLDFMDTLLNKEDHAYIMCKAWEIYSSGLEALRHQEIVDFRIQTAEMNKAKSLAAAWKALQTRRELRKIVVVTRTTDPSPLTIPHLHLQLNALHLCGVPNILPNSRYTWKPTKLEALKTTLKVYLPNLAKSPLLVDPEADFATATVEMVVVDDWTAADDREMEE